MRYPCSFDDDDFQFNKFHGFSRGRLLEEQLAIQLKIDGLQDRIDRECENDPDLAEELYEVVRRKRRQVQWIQARLATIRDVNRQRANARKRRDNLQKMDRQILFYRCFFEVCHREFEKEEIKELCQLAREKMDNLMKEVVQNPKGFEAPLKGLILSHTIDDGPKPQ